LLRVPQINAGLQPEPEFGIVIKEFCEPQRHLG